ncbi:DUF4179 domain-containing protein [Heyndrickxia sp. NPDC080065]|uniref:DUF4179 domain-containing protein n=1 Tax=Heyndrickxia sp. NPDC080065 TaxID=3390568 RepID=UPI003D01962B
MDKQWFNDEMNKIDVPHHDVRTAIKQGITKAQKERKQGKKMMKRLKVPLIASSLLIGVLGSGFVNPQMGRVLADVPFIGTFYSNFYFVDPVGQKLSERKLVTALNQKANNNNIDVTVNSAYYDGGRISVTFKVDNLKVDSDEFYFDFKIGDDSQKWQTAASNIGKVTSEGLIGHIQIDYPEKELPKKMTLPLNITSIQDIKGKWEFNVPIRQLPNKKIYVTESVATKDKKHGMQLESITLGKESSVFDYKAIHTLEGKYDWTRIEKITDDKGQEITKLMSGEEFGRNQAGNKIVSEERSIFGKIPNDAKFITIYSNVMEIENSGIHPLNSPTPFVMKSKRSGVELTVKKIQHKEKEKKLIVQFKLNNVSKEKSADELARNFIGLFYLVDSSMIDQDIKPLGHIVKGNDAYVLDEKNLLFESTFNLDGEWFLPETAIENFTLEGYSLEVPFTTSVPVKQLPPIKVKLK